MPGTTPRPPARELRKGVGWKMGRGHPHGRRRDAGQQQANHIHRSSGDENPARCVKRKARALGFPCPRLAGSASVPHLFPTYLKCYPEWQESCSIPPPSSAFAGFMPPGENRQADCQKGQNGLMARSRMAPRALAQKARRKNSAAILAMRKHGYRQTGGQLAPAAVVGLFAHANLPARLFLPPWRPMPGTRVHVFPAPNSKSPRANVALPLKVRGVMRGFPGANDRPEGACRPVPRTIHHAVSINVS